MLDHQPITGKTDALYPQLLSSPNAGTAWRVAAVHASCLSSDEQAIVADSWHSHAEELAEVFWRHFVNRFDVWGGYLVLPDGTPSTWTAPAKDKRGRELLTPRVLTRHFRARGRRDVIGLHSTSPDNRSKWGAVDIDRHGDAGPGPDVTFAAALGWYEALRTMGFRPWLIDSNGRGGFHLLALFSEAVETARVFAFLRWLTADFRDRGLGAQPETFPKQARIEPSRYGNWLRLVGRHHSRNHWSRIWDGSQWLEGAAGVAFILSCEGDPPGLLPLAPDEPPRPRPTPRRFAPVYRGDVLAAKILGYLRKLPVGLGEGMGRDDVAFRFAAWLARDMALPDEVALAWLLEWDRQNAVQKGEDALRVILENAKVYGRRPEGCGLQNEEATVRRRHDNWHITVRG